MEKKVKSNLALSLAILAAGLTGLMVMVWLSPLPSAGTAGVQDISSIHPQAPVLMEHPMGSTGMGSAAMSAAGMDSDPFAQKLGKPDSPQTTGASQENAIPAGVDPFKEKLLQQSRQATLSPFGEPMAKP
jgi:hypothetical protein